MGLFICLALLLLGPKFGYIDTSVFGGLFGLVYLIFRKKKVETPTGYFKIIVLMASALVYTVVLSIVKQEFDSFVILRIFRAFLTTMLIGPFVYNLDIKPQKLIDTLVYIFLLNAIVIIVQIQFPELQEIMAPYVGFDKHIRGMRAFGLTGGYDTAGYLNDLGCFMSGAVVYLNKKGRLRYIVFIAIFSISVLFTSRSAMVVWAIVIIIMSAVFLLKGDKILRVSAIAIIIGCSVAGYKYAYPLLSTTIGYGTFSVGSERQEKDYIENYAETDIEEWKSVSWFLPEKDFQIIFGTARDVKDTDVGYVIIVHMIGFVGLILAIVTYFLIAKDGFSIIRKMNRKRTYGSKEVKILAYCLLANVIILLPINMKNLYFYARLHNEIIMIIYFYVQRETRIEDHE